MKAENLRFFVAAATHGCLTLAANELRLTQPAISKQLKTLEQELGAKLYERNDHGISVTDAGELLLQKAQAILEQLDGLSGLDIVEYVAAPPQVT